MSIYDKMGFRLLLPPLLIALIGIVLMAFFNSHFSQVHPTGMFAPMIAAFSEKIYQALRWVPIAIMAVGTLWLAINIFRLIYWYLAIYLDWNQDICPNCGGMVSHHPNGRYGPYIKCLACGNNTSI